MVYMPESILSIHKRSQRKWADNAISLGITCQCVFNTHVHTTHTHRIYYQQWPSLVFCFFHRSLISFIKSAHTDALSVALRRMAEWVCDFYIKMMLSPFYTAREIHFRQSLLFSAPHSISLLSLSLLPISLTVCCSLLFSVQLNRLLIKYLYFLLINYGDFFIGNGHNNHNNMWPSRNNAFKIMAITLNMHSGYYLGKCNSLQIFHLLQSPHFPMWPIVVF